MGKKSLFYRWTHLGCVMLLSLCALSNIACDSYGAKQMKQGTPRLQLSLKENDPERGNIIVELLVENVGSHSLRLPYLQGEHLEEYLAWGGWVLDIQDQDLRLFIMGEKRPPLLKKNEMIELKPGEHFTVEVNISGASWFPSNPDDLKIPYPILGKTTAAYELSFGLDVSETTFPPHQLKTLWQGDLESNSLSVTVRQPEMAYLPKRLDYPARRAGEWVCQCRADCNAKVAGNPCLQFPPDEQSQTVMVWGTRYSEVIEEGRRLAREKLGAQAFPHQPCFCLGPNNSGGIDH